MKENLKIGGGPFLLGLVTVKDEQGGSIAT